MSKYSFIRVGPNHHPSLKAYTLDYQANKQHSELGGLLSLDQIRKNIFATTQIVCTTLSIAGSSILSLCKQPFDTVIIDEAGQATEPSTLIPLQYKSERVILLGDSRQLPATVFSDVCKNLGFGMSLFERLQLSGYPSTFLSMQYRMNADISAFISRQFYNDRLENHASLNQQFKKMGIFGKFKACFPFRFFSLAGTEENRAGSFANPQEALFIEYFLEFWLSLKTKRGSRAAKFPNFGEELAQTRTNLVTFPKNKIGVISPYKAQISLLTKKLEKFIKADLVEVKTVDGFQGREKGGVLSKLTGRFDYFFDGEIE